MNTVNSNPQKNAFLAYEADAWFSRNREYISNYDTGKDHVVTLLQDYGVKNAKVLEIGCSAGYRLNGIRNVLTRCDVYGIDPSVKAIEYGKAHFKDVTLYNGTADDLSLIGTASMDVVIAGFMLYVVDREILLKVVAEIDRVLKNGGLLVIIDFFAEATVKKPYAYITGGQEAFSFKQNYDEIFTATRLYHLHDRRTYSHLTTGYGAGNDHYNKYFISLLKKDIFASYK